MKKFDKKVRFEFRFAMHGYGRNTKEALLSALEIAEQTVKDMDKHDIEAVENGEIILIDEESTED